MGYSKDELDLVYQKTRGRCHICHKRLSRKNYGQNQVRGAWHVDHSRPRANGGSDYLNNLLAACVGCNCSKGAGTTRQARAIHGNTKAPLSQARYQEAKVENGVAGLVLFGFVGLAFAPGVALLAGLLGAVLGYSENPDHT